MASAEFNTNPNDPLKPNTKPLNPNAEPFKSPYCKPVPQAPLALPQPPLQPAAVGWPLAQQVSYYPVGSLYYPHAPCLPYQRYCCYNAAFQPQPYHKPSSLLYKDGDDFSGVDGRDEKALVIEGVVKKVEGLEAKDGRFSGSVSKVVSEMPRKSQRGKGSVRVWMQKCKREQVVGGIIESPVDALLRGKTTVMIRNIPNKLSREDLLHLLDQYCGAENQEAICRCDPVRSEYDFVYLPMDFKFKLNLGYAFVNFTSSDAAKRVCKYLHKRRWMAFESRKVCEICSAKIQGKQALVNHFRNSNFVCHTDDYLPVVLSPPRNGSDSCVPPRIVGSRVACVRKP